MKNKLGLTAGIFGLLTVGLQAGMEQAPAPAPSGASAGDFFLGVNAREEAWYGYTGANYSINRDKNAEGFIVHGMLGYGEYEYDTPIGGVEGEVFEFDLGIGYQWLLYGHKVALIGALNYVDHELTGNLVDLLQNSVNGSETGFKPKLDIWNTDASSYLYGGTFTYSTAYESYWNRIMFAPRIAGVYLGPELIFQGNEEYEEMRAGLTMAGLELGMANIGASVGYSWASPESGSEDQEGIYGAIHLSISF